MKLLVDGKEIDVKNQIKIILESASVSGSLEVTIDDDDVVFEVNDCGQVVATQTINPEQLVEMTIADNGFGEKNFDDDDY